MTGFQTAIGAVLISSFAAGFIPGGALPIAPAVVVDEYAETSAGGEIVVEQGITNPQVEAEALSDEIQELEDTPEAPVFTAFNPRVIQESYPGEFQSLDSATASFPLPEGCLYSAETTLQCATGPIILGGSAFDEQGNILGSKMEITNDAVIVTTEVLDGTDFPLTFSVFVSDSQSSPLIETGINSLSEMMDPESGTLSEAQLAEEERLLNESVSLDETNGIDPQAGASQFTAEPEHSRGAHLSGPSSLGNVLSASNSGALHIVPVAFSRPAYVGIPKGYRYCPKTCTPTRLHDYCSLSPDSFLNANFRGPCAKHDMRIDQIRKQPLSLYLKRSKRSDADWVLQSNLSQNCKNAYYKSYHAINRSTCLNVASRYWVGVTVGTWTWNGK